MLDGNSLLPSENCKYGAPMGRRSITDNPEAEVLLFRVTMVDQAYDCGGAYWGLGTPLYAAIGEGFQTFLRADSLQDATKSLLEQYPELKISYADVNDDFVSGYIETALATSCDEDGCALDTKYERSDIDPATLAGMLEDCREFLTKCQSWLKEEYYLRPHRMMQQAGCDFWLTRNRHGAGFWDGDWVKPAASELTRQAQEFGESYLFVTADGRVFSD